MISGTITAAINTLSRGIVIARLTSILGNTLTSKAARTAIIIITTTHTHLTEAAPALSTVSTLLLSTGPVKDALDINTFINVVIPLIKEPIFSCVLYLLPLPAAYLSVHYVLQFLPFSHSVLQGQILFDGSFYLLVQHYS